MNDTNPVVAHLGPCPTTRFWMTIRHEAVIRPVEVTKVLNRWVWIKHHWGIRKERKETLLHRYHETFDGAKRYLKAEFEVESKRAKAHVEMLDHFLEMVEKLQP